MKLSTKSREELIRFTKRLAATTGACSEFKTYMLNRDDAYYRGSNSTNTDENKVKLAKGDVVIPIVMAGADSARAFLATTFLGKEPIFSVVSQDAQLSATALMWNTLYENHSRRFSWKSQLSMCFNDALKYNLCAAELTWKSEYSLVPTGDKNAPLSNLLYQGNSIERINLYDAFWDSAVDASRVHIDGDYAGYSKIVSGTQLTRILLAYKNADEVDAAELKAAKDTKYSVLLGKSPSYTATGIAANSANITPELAAADFDGKEFTTSSSSLSGTRYYKLTTAYVRILPSQFGLAAAPDDVPKIFKLLIVNDDHLVVTQEQTNAHNYLPMVFGQALVDGLGYGSKSFTHNVEDIQQISSSLVNADIKSARRMLSDRGVYNPQLISKASIENPNPTAKIPLLRSAMSAKLSDAFLPIPYEDRNMGARMQQGTNLVSYANSILGQNPVTQGQFVKGNKTDGQFQESMASSNARMFALAVNLEDTFIYALKEMTKINILQFQPAAELVSRQDATTVGIDPVQLRKVQMEFSIADGLLSADRVAKTDLTMQAIQMLGQMAAATQQPLQYDIVAMSIHMLEQQGLKGLQQFKIQQQPQQPQQATNAPVQVPQ